MNAFALKKNKITTAVYQLMLVETSHQSIISEHSYKNIKHRIIWVQYLCGALGKSEMQSIN